MSRVLVPQSTETELLIKSGRRCALCYGLSKDQSEKEGQIAHLDQDASNNNLNNLCWLCLDHHNQYDSSTKQTKNYTEQEVKNHRNTLYSAIPNIQKTNISQAGSVSVSADMAAGNNGGGDVNIKGGVGRAGTSGGSIIIGPGTYKAGNGGPNGKGGNFVVQGGDSE
jgi:hypothetical protein